MIHITEITVWKKWSGQIYGFILSAEIILFRDYVDSRW